MDHRKSRLPPEALRSCWKDFATNSENLFPFLFLFLYLYLLIVIQLKNLIVIEFHSVIQVR